MLNANRTMVKIEEDFISTIKQRPEKKEIVKPIKTIDCPVCNGSGERIDKNTHQLRPCVGCKGTGKLNYGTNKK